MTLIDVYLMVYGAVALGHIALQMLFGQLEHRRQRRLPHAGSTPTVTVVVPAYNEDPVLLHRCLLSIDRQDYPRIETIVVDDGSNNIEDVLPVHDEFSGGGRFRIVLQADNSGKRDCQAVVFEQALGEIVVTIDSDTVLDPGAIRTIVRRFADPEVGAVTGNVAVINKHQNLLTRLIGYRYWTAFNQERAAQSLFGVVMCCSGPFSAYRRSIIDQVRESYVSQHFLGRRCTFGDDRHLTNLVLALGYDVVYDEAAVARTRVPNRIRNYLRQQVRWNKSFYREILWNVKFVHQRNAYMALDLGLQTFMPFALLIALGLIGYAASTNPSDLLRYGAIVAGIGLVRALYGLFRTKDGGFLLFVLYGFLHVFLLIPVRLYSLATLRKAHWGTRGSDGEERAEERQSIVQARSPAGVREAEATWSNDVHRTVAAGESFILHWQPVRDLRTGELNHAEMLLRLRHRGTVLPPLGFLGIAEEHRLMGMIDERVLRDTVAVLKAHGSEPLRLEINVSSQSMRDPQFSNQVATQLSYEGVSPRRLVLTIPERAAIEHPVAALAFVRRLRSVGCLVGLDQFGASCADGDSSVSETVLANLPFDYVKLDGALVKQVPHSEEARENLQRLVRLSRMHGAESIAMFVGDDETVELLRRERVDHVQGFHVGGPSPLAMSLEEIASRAAKQHMALAI